MIGRLERRCHLKFKKYGLPVHKNSAGILKSPVIGSVVDPDWHHFPGSFSGGFLGFLKYFIQHCFIYHLSDFTVSLGSPDPGRI
jgi:hypothetical protein